MRHVEIVAAVGLALAGLTGCYGTSDTRITHVYELKDDPTPENLDRIREYLSDADRDVRATAVYVLASAGVPDASEITRNALHDADGFVRSTAAKCLGDLADPAAVPDLVERLDADEDWHVRQRAADALAAIGGEQAAAGLGLALEDPIKQVRLAAVKGVAATNPEAYLAPLSRIVTDDAEWEIRVQAAGALGRSRSGEARAPLEQASTDPNEFVRAAAVRALRELAGPADRASGG